MTTARKPKRKLTDISFQHEGAHVALVSKDQGGPANGHSHALVMKATNFSEEFLAKAAKIRITMDIEEFLVKFYGLWYEDAEILARALGFDTAEEDMQEDESKSYQQEYEDYIQSKVDSIEVLKQLVETDSIPEVLSKLNEDQYLTLLKDQSKLEKAFTKAGKLKESNKSVTSKEENDELENSTNASVEKSVGPSGSDVNKKETTMTEEVKEMVEKAALTEVQKALDALQVQLEKANATVAQFEAEKKLAVEKARKDQVLAAVKDADKAEVLFKAVKEASDEDFTAVVKTLTDMQVAVEKSALFQEQGASTEDTPVVQESAVAKVLKSRQAK